MKQIWALAANTLFYFHVFTALKLFSTEPGGGGRWGGYTQLAQLQKTTGDKPLDWKTN